MGRERSPHRGHRRRGQHEALHRGRALRSLAAGGRRAAHHARRRPRGRRPADMQGGLAGGDARGGHHGGRGGGGRGGCARTQGALRADRNGPGGVARGGSGELRRTSAGAEPKSLKIARAPLPRYPSAAGTASRGWGTGRGTIAAEGLGG